VLGNGKLAAGGLSGSCARAGAPTPSSATVIRLLKTTRVIRESSGIVQSDAVRPLGVQHEPIVRPGIGQRKLTRGMSQELQRKLTAQPPRTRESGAGANETGPRTS
jgi:hypothetical protein